MTKNLAAFALVAGMSIGLPAVASACGACGNRAHVPQPVYHQPVAYQQPVCAPVRPVCQPVCQPVCDPCRRSGLFGLGILGIL